MSSNVDAILTNYKLKAYPQEKVHIHLHYLLTILIYQLILYFIAI